MAENKIAQIQWQFMLDSGNNMRHHWKYYQGDKSVIPIYNRKAASPLKEKSHTNRHVDYYGDIIDNKQGYMGEAIEIVYNGEDERMDDELKRLEIDTRLNTMNSQTIEYSSVEGISHRLIYTKDGEFKSKNLHGWQVIYDWDDDFYNPNLAYYFYSEQALGETEPTNYCNLYDKTKVYYYKQEKKKKRSFQKSQEYAYGGNYILADEQLHNFNRVPVIPFKNTANDKGNCFQSVGLMNDYDEIISDISGEIKASRLAYLKIYGDLYTAEGADGQPVPIPDYLKEFGTMIFGQTQDGKPLGDAEFLEKKIDDAATENLLNRERGHIYETSGSVDLKELTAAQRVFSIKASLRRLENNAKTSENYFKIGMQSVIKLWLYWLSIKGMTADYVDFQVIVGRIFPQDEAAQAEIFNKYAGILSTEDALRLAGIENPLEIAERADDIVLPPLPEEVVEDGE